MAGLDCTVKLCEEFIINDLNTNGYSKKELDQIFKLKQKEYIYNENDKSKNYTAENLIISMVLRTILKTRRLRMLEINLELELTW